MNHARIRQIVRQFRENGLKLLLEHPQNVRELLQVAGSQFVRLIDFDRLTPIQTTFVDRDYRHVESDVVLVAPVRRPGRGRARNSVLIYILIEHQSEPDRLMPLRVLEYMVQIFKFQTREWSRRHRSLASVRLQPVLPVVFYTGTRRWESVGRLIDLVEMGDQFGPVTPDHRPLFVNLPAVPGKRLESAGGYFGSVLRLLQSRKARPHDFQLLLRRVVRHLETMPGAERLRWLELLSYVQAMVYHERDPAEGDELCDAIEASVATDEHRQEVQAMGKTIADELIERGEKKGRQEGEAVALRRTLLRHLHGRFGDLPPEITRTVELTSDVTQLDSWIDNVVTARSLKEVGIRPTN